MVGLPRAHLTWLLAYLPAQHLYLDYLLSCTLLHGPQLITPIVPLPLGIHSASRSPINPLRGPWGRLPFFTLETDNGGGQSSRFAEARAFPDGELTEPFP